MAHEIALQMDGGVCVILPTRPVSQGLACEQTMAGYLSFLIFSPESTRTISSKMAAIEEVLVSDLNKMSAEELRSRGWALVTVKHNKSRLR